jgi:chromate reductase, NAD(P)H dehydrogenase (quinone)
MKILAISGSLRTDSYNRKALQIAMRFVRELGADVEEIDLRELNLPMYDGDIEAKGLPEPVERLKAAIAAADVLLVATPEYNYSTSGVLKNALDWASRGGNAFDGKYAALFGVSTGLVGTLRAQFQLRQMFLSLNVFVLPQPQVLIRSAAEAFDESGELKDPKVVEQLRSLIEKTIRAAQKIKQ